MRAESLPTLRRVLSDHRRGFAIWAASLAAITIFYMAFWPTMGAEMLQAIEGMPEGLMVAMGYDRIGTAAGYLEAVVYGLLGPIMLLVYGIGLGARLVAGQEEDGTLELDLAAPLPRGRLYAERLGALWLLLAGQVVAVTVAVLVSDPLFDLDLDVGHVVAASFGLLLLLGGYATAALAIGAATGRRALALGIVSGLAVLGYVFRGVANAADVDLLAALSPFSWFLDPDPLANGFDFASTLRLAAIVLVAAPLGAWVFRRRDLMA
jgi:ABC-2 type transport system permease protein